MERFQVQIIYFCSAQLVLDSSGVITTPKKGKFLISVLNLEGIPYAIR